MPSSADMSCMDEEHSTEDAVDYNHDCWKALEAEVGFHSYIDYLKENYKDLLDAKDIGRYYKYDSKDIARQRQRRLCCVFDISHEGELSQSLLIPDYGPDYLPPVHATTLLKTLREPPASARARVLLFHSETTRQRRKSTLDPAWLNAIGLGLGMHPVFIGSIIHAQDEGSEAFPLGSGGKRRPRRTHDASHVVIAESSITIARNYLPGKGDVPPVVVILGAPARSLRSSKPPERSIFEPVKVQESRPGGGIARLWPNRYMASLADRLRNVQSRSFHLDNVILCALMPLLEGYIDEKSMEYRDNFEEFAYILETESDEPSLERLRFKARRQMRDLEQCLSDFRRFLRVQCTAECPEEKSFVALEQDLKEYLNDARGLESEIRDLLQLRVGNLALEESKKSIELSNLQIEESKRVKIVTVLAFVYVPLNLATSIFGMNIQELNQNGQNVGVFIITAFVTLAVTGLVWLGTEVRAVLRKWREVQDARSLQDKLFDRWRGSPNVGHNYSFAVKIAMLVYLLANGHIKWAWVTNAATRVLIHDRLGRRSFHAAIDDRYMVVLRFNSFTMCEYIYYHAYEDCGRGWFHAPFFTRPKGDSASRPTGHPIPSPTGHPSPTPTSLQSSTHSASSLPTSPAESIIWGLTSVRTSIKQGSNRDGRGDSIEMRSRGNASDAGEEV